MSKNKGVEPIEYYSLVDWVERHDACMTQAGHFPASVLYVTPEDLPVLVKFLGLPDMGKLSGGRCYMYQGDDFFAVVICINPTSGQVLSAVAHECYHAVNFMYKKYGARHSLSNDENTAYLLGYLAYYAGLFLEEHGYGFAKLHDTGSGAHSGDLRDELHGDTAGRDEARPHPDGRTSFAPQPETVELTAEDDESTVLLSCGCAGRCIGHPMREAEPELRAAPDECAAERPVHPRGRTRHKREDRHEQDA